MGTPFKALFDAAARSTSMLLVFAMGLSQVAWGQEHDEQTDQMPMIQKNDTTYLLDFKKKNFRFTPFLAPSVSPEMGVLFSGGGLMSFSFQRQNPKLQASSVSFGAGISTTGAVTINVRPTFFFKNDKNRVVGEFNYRNMPDNYWGVGYDNARAPSATDSTTAYNREWYQALLRYMYQFKPNWFVGLLMDFNGTNPSDLSDAISQDPDLTSNPNPRIYQLGTLFQYDSRDFTVNAYKGLFVELATKFVTNNDDQEYGLVSIDYRHYFTIKRPGSTLAWQIKSRNVSDNAPWTELSFVGSPYDLRGYYFGRYRDRSSLFGIVEYRYMFKRKTPRKKDPDNYLSRFGLVGWAGGGSVAPKFGEYKDWLPNAGVGIRFEVQPRMNARIDLGWGDDSALFYINFNEAF